MLLGVIISIFCLSGVLSESVAYSGKGFATYYYDVKTPVFGGTDFTNQNKGFVGCSPQNALSLSQIGSNMLVAMNNTQMKEDMGRYCGKKVVISVNGKESDLPCFIGDGCERCANGSPSGDSWDANGTAGIDFSLEAFMKLSKFSPGNAYQDGHFAITWKILNEHIYRFDSSKIDTAAASSSPISVESRCPESEWQCDGNLLKQCVGTAWIPRATCPPDLSCLGGAQPYCGQIEMKKI